MITNFLKPVLGAAKGDISAINVYSIIENALLTTIQLIEKTASAQSKVKEGYYLASTGKGVIRIEYYLFYR